MHFMNVKFNQEKVLYDQTKIRKDGLTKEIISNIETALMQMDVFKSESLDLIQDDHTTDELNDLDKRFCEAKKYIEAVLCVLVKSAK